MISSVLSGLRTLATGRGFGMLFVLVLVVWAYGECLSFGSLNYDDPMYISNPGGASDGLDLKVLVWSLTATRSNLWHPLTWLSFQIECAVAGNSKWQGTLHHLSNLLLYLAMLAVMAWGLLRLKLPAWGSVLFLAAFGLHPLHVESVAWISSRKDVLSGLFQALCLVVYLTEWKSRRPWLTLIFFLLAVLSKPSAIVTPALLILINEALRKRDGETSCLGSVRGITGQLLEKRWFWAIAFLSACGTIWVQAQGTMAGVSQSAGLIDRLALVPAKIGAYFSKVFVPVHLTFEYPTPSLLPLIGFSLLGLIVVLVPLVEYLRHRSFSWLGLALLWFLVCISPVLGWVLVSDSFINDRYAFWAMAGPIAWLIGFAFKISSRAAAIAGVLIVGWFLVATRQQVSVWQTDESLFRHALTLYPAHLTALGNMGTLERSGGNDDSALGYYNRALRVNPRDHIVLYNKAQILARKGQIEEAIRVCEQCLEAYPNYEGAVNLQKFLLLKSKGNTAPPR
ncbi:MAG: tetratricopeptide repeat protein [Akkermansiaceae bacterium]